MTNERIDLLDPQIIMQAFLPKSKFPAESVFASCILANIDALYDGGAAMKIDTLYGGRAGHGKTMAVKKV